MNLQLVQNPLAALLEDRIRAKRIEEAAIKVRREIDAKIAEALRDPSKPEGAITESVGDLKVTVTYGIDRKVDNDALQKAYASLRPAVREVFRFKAELAVGAYRKLDDPRDLNQAAQFITSKPSSPSVQVAVA